MLRKCIADSLERLESYDPRGFGLIVLPWRDLPVVKACGLEPMARSLSTTVGVTDNDVCYFFKLLSERMIGYEPETAQIEEAQ
jgi:hypothetical protein